jgi:L-alanine-DL-glutamate epimerase-like enolase superfamily enzyme
MEAYSIISQKVTMATLSKKLIHPARGHLTESGLKHLVQCIEALRNGVSEEAGLALDCGPGVSVPGAIKFAKAIEKYNILWLEDLITGDFYPYTEVEAYKIVRLKSKYPYTHEHR